jgi:hypothetical protein
MPIAFVGLLILAVVAYELSRHATAAAADSIDSSGDDAPAPGIFQDLVGEVTLSGITFDPSTWPTGDRIWDIAQAIAHAEGANVEGSNPDVLNNPGDISDGASTYGAEFHSGSNVTHFPDKKTGWQWLYNKLQNIDQGGSHVYSRDMSWEEIAHDPATGATRWAGDWQNWSRNVAAALGVDPTSTFGEYVDS